MSIALGLKQLKNNPLRDVIGISALACVVAGFGGLLSPRLRQITRKTDTIESFLKPIVEKSNVA